MTINSIQALSEDIARLRELKERVQHVRQLPPMLMKSTAKGTTADAFARMRALGEHLASEATQRALVRARDSLAEDPSDVRGEGRPQRRTRTRGRSPEGHVAEEEERGAPLPHSTEPGVTVSELGEWARAYNSTHTNKIRIRGRTLRMAIPDVMTVYMGIGTQERVVVETIRAFGSRETSDGLGQSGFGVFRVLSQQLNKMLDGQLPLQTVVAVVEAYENVFDSRCTCCGRVVGMEGDLPGVVRRWTGRSWRVEHIECAIGGR